VRRKRNVKQLKTLTHPELLRYALAGLEARKQEIEREMAELRKQIGPAPKLHIDEEAFGQIQPIHLVKRRGRPPGFKVTAKARKNMARAQRERWRKRA
jgi:hypothetical protein